MSETERKQGDPSIGIPQQVCERFLEELLESEVPEDIVINLRKTLLEKKDFTEDSIRSALFPHDSRP